MTDSAVASVSPRSSAEVEYHRLHRVAIGAEHEVAELVTDHLFPAIELFGALLERRRLVGQADLEALPAARKERQRGRVRPLQLLDHVVEALVEPALALAPRAQHPAGDHRVVTAAAAQIGQDRPMHHVVHLMRHAGHRVHDLVDAVHRDGTDQPRSGAAGLRDDRRARRHLRLAQVVLRHSSSPGGEHLPDHVGDGIVGDQIDAHHRSDRITREVVVGGAETAAHDHRIGGLEEPPELGLDPPDVVADLHLHERVDAVRRQLPADPRRVGIDDLAEQQLGADRENVAAKSHSAVAARPTGSTVVDGATASSRRARSRYCAPLTSASATASHRKPFHSHVASTAVSGRSAKATASC